MNIIPIKSHEMNTNLNASVPSATTVPAAEASSSTAVSQTTTRTPTTSRSTLNRLTRQFATQAMLYCLAFFITWLFPTIGVIIGLVNDGQKPFIILFLSGLLTPLQGFGNAFIYLRPRYLRYRKRQQEKEERHRHAQEQAEAKRTARVARLLAQQGLAFVQALSVQHENDEDDNDEEDEDYLIIYSNADETRIVPAGEETNHNDNIFLCSTTPPSFNETYATPPLPPPLAVTTTSRRSTETCAHEDDDKMPEPSDGLKP